MQRGWQDLLALVANDDGLPVRECHSGTVDKLYFWSQYLGITTKAMVGKRAWSGGLCYVDMFAGPGVCFEKATRTRVPGSPVLAVSTPKPFEKVLLVEQDPILAEACQARLAALAPERTASMIRGDCNEEVGRIRSALPQRSLTLAFVDPEGFDARLDTLRELTRDRSVDFLLLFADRIDLVRNVRDYAKQQESKVDQMLGIDSEWRREWEALPDQSDSPRVRKMFADLYKAQVRKHLGYTIFREKEISGSRGSLYRLVFASRNEKGAEFWDKIVERDRGGQRSLFSS